MVIKVLIRAAAQKLKLKILILLLLSELSSG